MLFLWCFNFTEIRFGFRWFGFFCSCEQWAPARFRLFVLCFSGCFAACAWVIWPVPIFWSRAPEQLPVSSVTRAVAGARASRISATLVAAPVHALDWILVSLDLSAPALQSCYSTQRLGQRACVRTEAWCFYSSPVFQKGQNLVLIFVGFCEGCCRYLIR
jgi:hypothetical protein